jgi:hypothetical protein
MAAPKKASRIENLVQDVTNRYRVTAREARDIVTSVANAASVGYSNMGPKTNAGPQTGKMLKDIGKQVKETAVAAATGKKGTTALKVKDNPKDSYVVNKNQTNVAKTVKPGTKRK